jgi:hypothetical protein
MGLSGYKYKKILTEQMGSQCAKFKDLNSILVLTIIIEFNLEKV